MSTVDCCCSSMSCVRPKTNWKKIHPWAANVWEAIVFKKSPLAKRFFLSAKWFFFQNQHANLTCVQHGFISCHIISWLDDLFSHKSQLKQKCLSCQVMPSERWRKSAKMTNYIISYGHMVTYHIVSYLVSYLTSHHVISDHNRWGSSHSTQTFRGTLNVEFLLFLAAQRFPPPSFGIGFGCLFALCTLCTSRTPYGIAPNVQFKSAFYEAIYKKETRDSFPGSPAARSCVIKTWSKVVQKKKIEVFAVRREHRGVKAILSPKSSSFPPAQW